MGKRSKPHPRSHDRSFRSPPLWIHVAQAGRWLFSSREAKKRAVVQLLDSLSVASSRKPLV
jgi:hypothetical protein